MAITLDGTTGITTPGLSLAIENFSTTGNTTLGDASTDTLNVGNGGLVKDSSGNVGIGTASPTSKLQVAGSGFFSSRSVPTSGAGPEIYYDGTNAGWLSYNRTTSAYIPSVFDGSQYTFNISGSSGMVLNTSGNLGVGTSSPATKLNVAVSAANETTSALRVTNLNTLGYGIGIEFADELSSGRVVARIASITPGTSATGELYFQTRTASALTEKMRLDSSGNLGIGTTSPAKKLQINSSDTTDGIRLYCSDTGGENLSIVWQSAYGPNRITGEIKSNASGAGGNFILRTTNTSAVLTEALRVDNAQNLLVGTTTLTAANLGAGRLQVAGEIMCRGSFAGIFWENRSGGVTSSSNWYGLYNTGGTNYIFNGATNIASINSTTGVYTALSDRNKKKDFDISAIGLAEVMLLKPTLFRMLEDSEDTPKQLGFIAQDVRDVVPQAYVEHSLVDAGGKQATYIGLNNTPIIAALTTAIQEQQALITTLTARITALEGA